MAPPDHRQAADRLTEACRQRQLDQLLAEAGVAVLVVFGSAARPGAGPANDLDVGILPRRGLRVDLVSLSDALAAAAGPAEVDLVDLSTGPVTLRAEALSTGLPLYESEPGAWANAQMAATLERWDTAWLRELDLHLMARPRGG